MQLISKSELLQELKSNPRQLVLVEGIDGCQRLAKALHPEYRRRYVPWNPPVLDRSSSFPSQSAYEDVHKLHREQQIDDLRTLFSRGRLESTVLQRSIWTSYMVPLIKNLNPRALDPYRTAISSLPKDAEVRLQQLRSLVQETRGAVVILGRRVSDRYGGKRATSLYLEFARECKDLFYVEYPDADDSPPHEYDAQTGRSVGLRLAQLSPEQEAQHPVDD